MVVEQGAQLGTKCAVDAGTRPERRRERRTVIERGPKGKKSVAFSLDWPGWSRGAKSPELALETHAREELGVDPRSLGSPIGAAASSFASRSSGRFGPNSTASICSAA